MKVIIVGAGYGGLSAAIACRKQGYDVLVFEQAPQFMRLGDSIGFGPNASRLLCRWGLGDDMAAISCKAKEMVLKHWDTGEVILSQPTGINDEAAPSMIGHRGDYHMIMFDHAQKMGADIRMGVRVQRYDDDKPSVILDSGEEFCADIVIGADGVKSAARTAVLGYEDKPKSSGYAVYRAFFPGERLKDDPLVARFLERDLIYAWIGPDMHGFVTSLRDGREINWVLTHRDDANVDEGWAIPGNMDDVKALMKGWDPLFRHVVDKCTECIDWKLVFRDPLPTWVSKSGKIILLGDSAHPFLPTSTQGASQTIEDSATIALCLHAAGERNVPLATRTWEKIRYERVKTAQKAGETQRDKWHNAHSEAEKSGEFNKSQELDTVVLWNHDAELEFGQRWDEVSRQVRENMSVKVS